MKQRDYLWCLANLVLDKQEQLERLCPDCYAKSRQDRCPVCGADSWKQEHTDSNETFDWKRYERMKKGAQE